MNFFSFPTPIHFGAGARNKVKEHLRAQGLKKPLVVTDRGVAQLGFYKDLLRDLEAAGFSEIWGNPVKSQVSAGVAAYKAAGADCIVGLGGGAALDVAKAIALM